MLIKAIRYFFLSFYVLSWLSFKKLVMLFVKTTMNGIGAIIDNFDI
jgi:hypothetical protein